MGGDGFGDRNFRRSDSPVCGGKRTVRSTTYLDRNLSSKEGDNTLMPLSRTTTELPSEVGFSESMMLRKDADRWMGMAGPSQVKLVILVRLHKDSRSTTKRVE
ncbi:hypothetical protein B0H14DRAFT_2605582 [Mycena olivaceomarginata]|nr:hypothetical protein B0H14DRAFT_2605582 [Mycena olivaceomarginata]